MLKRGDFQLFSWKWSLSWPGAQGWLEQGKEEEKEVVESQPPRKEQSVAPVPSGRDLFCIPRRRRLPSPGLRSLPQTLLQGMGMGVRGLRGSPSGRAGEVPWQAMQREETQRNGLFLPLPPPPLASSEQDIGEGIPTLPLASRGDAHHDFSSFLRWWHSFPPYPRPELSSPSKT